MQEPFHIIVSTMRSGSSLFGHLLAEAGWIRYAGETHARLDGEAGIEDAIRKIRNQAVELISMLRLVTKFWDMNTSQMKESSLLGERKGRRDQQVLNCLFLA